MSDRPPFSTDSLELFEVLDRLGKGAMGTVWRASHRRTGQHVAVKVINVDTEADSGDPRGLFLGEARSMAAMSHPNIVRILDFGHIDDGVAYIVMELADGGCLSPKRFSDWPTLRECLFQILDGLAHAHSQDRVHLDLKPSNVLRSTGRRYMIADFGIAYRLGARYESQQIGGTPAYMAPEQALGQRGMLGPWTDLYALGCLTWHLATGEPPFAGANFVAIANAQVHQPLPAFEPRFSVPGGLFDWLDTLLAKEPAERYSTAAAAAFALSKLGDGTAVREDSAQSQNESAAESMFAETLVFGEAQTAAHETAGAPTELMATLAAVTIAAPDATSAPQPSNAVDSPQESPPFPDDWRRGQTVTPLTLEDAGAGLFDLRPSPFVGRAEEFDWLWQRFGDVVRSKRPAHYFMEGPPGVGKTRLVDAFGRRLRELGQARVLHFDFGGQPWAQVASRALSSFLRVTSSSDSTFAAQAQMRIPNADLEQLSRLVDLPEGAFSHRASHLSAVADVVAAMAERRPLVLLFDHVSVDTSSFDFAQMFTRRFPEAPVMMVTMSSEEEALPIVAERADLNGVERLDLQALTPAQAATFIERTLPLTDDEVRRLLEGTDFAPGYARQVIARWLETDQLTAHPNGYHGGPLPESQHALWMERLFDIASSIDVDEEIALHALQAAAVLGTTVEKPLWREVCQRVGLDRPPKLIEALVRKGFVRDDDALLTFGDTTLHRAVLDALEGTERARPLYAAAADVLVDEDQRLSEVRAAQCLAKAGRFAEALSLLDQEALYTTTADSLAIFQWKESLYQTHPDPAFTEERLRTMVNTAMTHLDNADFAAADIYIEQFADELHEDSPVRLLGERDRLLATRALYKNEPLNGLEPAYAALEVSQKYSSPIEICMSHGAIGDLLMYALRFDEARDHYESALDLAANFDEFQRAWAEYAMGTLMVHTGEFDLADRHLNAALDHFHDTDFPFGMMYVRHSLGLMAYQQGDFATAETVFEAALDDARMGDHRFGVNLHEHLGRLFARTERPEEALAHIEHVRTEAERTSFDYMVWYFFDAEIEALARLERWEECERVLSEAVQTSAKPGLYASNIAATFERITDLARDAGRGGLAEAASNRAEHVRRYPHGKNAAQ